MVELPQLFTSRWTSPLLHDLGAACVGISRGVPRWPLPYRYKLLRLLAPSRETFELRDLQEFEQAYLAALEEIGVKKISDEHGGRPLALLCYENILAGETCHRRMFADWWKQQTTQEVPELDGRVEVKPQTLMQEILSET